MIKTTLDNLRTLAQVAEQQGLSTVACDAFIAYDRARTTKTFDSEKIASIIGELIRQLENRKMGAFLTALEINQ